MHAEHRQLCWTCQRAYGDCPWTETDPDTKKTRFAPVPGWDAEKTIRSTTYGKQKAIIESYAIKRCPLYIREQRRAAT